MPKFSRSLSVQSPLMRGPDVLGAQRALRSLGALEVEPDGIFGPMTARAVQAFRRDRHMPDSDSLDEPVWNLLFAEPAAAPNNDIAGALKQLVMPHQFRDSIAWCFTQTGIAVGNAAAVGTPGEPLTVRRIMTDYGTALADSCTRHGVPVELVVATIATESSGDANADRKEPGYVSDEATPDKRSIGLMQTLISTARGATGDNPAVDAAWLRDPANSIEAGTAYIAGQLASTGYDPPKVACAYNAGGLFYEPSPANRWRMRQYPIGTSAHADRFIAFFNDTVFSLRSTPDSIGGPSFASRLGVALAASIADPQIEKLALRPTARSAAYALKLKHPQVVFTSGRRGKADQARAMSQNVAGRRDWIGTTYLPTKASKACQDWVDAHPDAISAGAIEAGLMSVFASLADAELGQLSRHLSGDAFDIQPLEPDKAGIKDTIRGLPGLRQFLDREGGLVRWHAEFNA